VALRKVTQPDVFTSGRRRSSLETVRTFGRLRAGGKVRNVSPTWRATHPAFKARRRDGEPMTAIRQATQAELASYGYRGVTYEG